MPTSPPYCLVCGNLDFVFHDCQWLCSFCHPAISRMPKNAPGFFTADQTRAAWPDGWSPPKPTGPAARAVAMPALYRPYHP